MDIAPGGQVSGSFPMPLRFTPRCRGVAEPKPGAVACSGAGASLSLQIVGVRCPGRAVAALRCAGHLRRSRPDRHHPAPRRSCDRSRGAHGS